GYIIDVHIIPKDRRGIDIGTFYGGTGKTEVSRIGQSVTHILCKTIDGLFPDYIARFIFVIHRLSSKTVLGTMGFIRNHDNILPIRKRFEHISLFRLELLNSRKNYTAGVYFQQVFQLLPVTSLYGILTQ